MAAAIARGDVRLYEFASSDKVRPVLVLTRQSAIGFLNTVTVAAITSTIRGVASEVLLTEDDGMKNACAVNLYNLACIRADHLGRKLTQLSEVKMQHVCKALGFAVGCEGEQRSI
jgi:mRNA interferase MazF